MPKLTSCECILEDLLKAKELQDAKINAWVEPETAFVRTQCRVELYTESAIDLQLAFVVFPGDAKLDDSLRDCSDLERLLVFWVLFEECAVL